MIEPEVLLQRGPWHGGSGDGTWYNRTERVVLNGITYERSSYGAGKPALPCKGHFATEQGKEPGVLCGSCQGTTFTLRYGSFSISAKCAQCGHDDEVYSR